jgi:hypothetical protein
VSSLAALLQTLHADFVGQAAPQGQPRITYCEQQCPAIVLQNCHLSAACNAHLGQPMIGLSSGVNLYHPHVLTLRHQRQRQERLAWLCSLLLLLRVQSVAQP